MLGLYIMIAVLVILLVFAFVTYNSLVKLNNKVTAKKSKLILSVNICCNWTLI